MKTTLAAVALLALVAVGVAVAYQAAARERDYRELLGKGDAALVDAKTFDAIEAYSGAIALRPDSMLAYLRRGETYEQRNDLGAASRDLGKATTLDPSATRPLEDLGDVEYQRQRFNHAAKIYETRLQLDRSANITYKLALARYRDGNVDGALTALADALKLDDQLADAYYLNGICFREEHKLPQALASLERAVTLSPGLIPAREELADLYGSLDRHADELEQLQVLAGLDRDHVERHVAVGLAEARAGHWDLAVLTLGGALERTPNEPLIYGALGQVWLERPRDRNDHTNLSKARDALERVVSSPTAPSAVLALYGRALIEDGDADGAERTLQQATTRYPVDPSAFVEYATVAERLNHLGVARSALIDYDALTSDDTDLGARATHIGTLSLRLNDAAAAVPWFERAAAAMPHDMRAVAALADAEIKSGEADAAKATVAKGLEKDPSDTVLQSLSRRLGGTGK